MWVFKIGKKIQVLAKVMRKLCYAWAVFQWRCGHSDTSELQRSGCCDKPSVLAPPLGRPVPGPAWGAGELMSPAKSCCPGPFAPCPNSEEPRSTLLHLGANVAVR